MWLCNSSSVGTARLSGLAVVLVVVGVVEAVRVGVNNPNVFAGSLVVMVVKVVGCAKVVGLWVWRLSWLPVPMG